MVKLHVDKIISCIFTLDTVTVTTKIFRLVAIAY